MTPRLLASQWSALALSNAFVIGAASVAFLRWRMGKKVVSREFWKRLVDGYVTLERSFHELNSRQDDSLVAYQAISDRLDRSNQENHALQQRLQALESYLNSVTDEATTLVNGLKDNEQRWVEAETVRTDLQSALEEAQRQIARDAERYGSISVANEELARRLKTTTAELSRATLLIGQLQADLIRRSTLEAHLNEALDRYRQQTSILARLEDRYQQAHRELVEANRRATHLEGRLQAEMAIEPQGVFDCPVPAARPISIDGLDSDTIDLRAEPTPSRNSPLRPHRHRVTRADRLARSHGRLPD